jgi:hypothetical protein
MIPEGVPTTKTQTKMNILSLNTFTLLIKIVHKKSLKISLEAFGSTCNSIELFSNQMLEFLTHFVENMP